MAACCEALEEYLRLACQAADHTQAHLVSLYLALGVVEAALTSKTACQAPLKPEQLQARQRLARRVIVASASCPANVSSECARACAGSSGRWHGVVPWLCGGGQFQAGSRS